LVRHWAYLLGGEEDEWTSLRPCGVVGALAATAKSRRLKEEAHRAAKCECHQLQFWRREMFEFSRGAWTPIDGTTPYDGD